MTIPRNCGYTICGDLTKFSESQISVHILKLPIKTWKIAMLR